MPMLEPRRLIFRSLLFGLPCLACQEPVAPAGADTEISGASTTPEPSTSSPVPPTTTPGDDGPMTPTTTATTMTSTTGDVPGTSSGETNTTMVDSWCGDGIVDADEACDDGLAGNDDSRFCKADCTLNVCGDGKLFVGWELCDDGAANSDKYGSLCGVQCEPGARCGDHKLQPEFETCDLGPNNGDPKGDEQGIVCDGSCRALRLRGFVTKDSYTGDLGGLWGADQKCRNAAKAAGLAEPERFNAFLSTKDIAAKARFEAVPASLPYVLVTGTKFAENFAALISVGPLGTGISVTEEGATLYDANVATNTQPGGIAFSPEQHCQSWTSKNGDFMARVGHSGVEVDGPDADTWKDNLWWTGFWTWPCDKTFFHLYCLEI